MDYTKLYNDYYCCDAVNVPSNLDKAVSQDYATSINKQLINNIIEQTSCYPNRYNIVENATDEELIDEIKRRKIKIEPELLITDSYIYLNILTGKLKFLI